MTTRMSLAGRQVPGWTFTLPVGGLGFNVTGQYADGAVGYVGDFGADFEQNADGSVETTQAWTVRAGLSAGFTDKLKWETSMVRTPTSTPRCDVNDLTNWGGGRQRAV